MTNINYLRTKKVSLFTQLRFVYLADLGKDQIHIGSISGDGNIAMVMDVETLPGKIFLSCPLL